VPSSRSRTRPTSTSSAETWATHPSLSRSCDVGARGTFPARPAPASIFFPSAFTAAVKNGNRQ
jgi:hypothetical protein